MYAQYRKAYRKLVLLTSQFNENISVEAWNKYAKDNNYLSVESMKFISGLNWNELKSKIDLEKNKF